MSSDLFIIGASGTKAYRAALGAVSENIANANTANYNRRTITTRESALSASTSVLYVPQTSFGGVEIASVGRANDPYLDATARLTGTALGSADTRLRWLTDIETALNDGARGVGSTLSDLFGSVEKLAANPGDPSLRTNMLFAVEQTVNAFNQSAADLDTASQGIAATAQNEIASVNDALAELSRINANLLRSQPGTANQAQLLDSRDAALADVTRRLDVSVRFGPNGAAILDYKGTNILEGTSAAAFAVNRNSDGTLALSLNGGATPAPASGVIGGLFQSATVATQRIASLDALAAQFAQDLNAWHGQGLTDGGAAGGPLVSIGTTAASLTVALADISGIAARSADGRLNGNLLNVSSIRGAGSTERGWTALVAANANMLSAIKSEQAAAQTRDTQARQARENVSGVDLDMEAADLLRIQQAYQGCAKVIQIARETIESILAIL